MLLVSNSTRLCKNIVQTSTISCAASACQGDNDYQVGAVRLRRVSDAHLTPSSAAVHASADRRSSLSVGLMIYTFKGKLFTENSIK
jgi:hypothetical protein